MFKILYIVQINEQKFNKQMPRPKKPKVEALSLGRNPFTETDTFIIHTRKWESPDTYKVIDGKRTKQVIEVEATKFTKFFVPATLVDRIFELSLRSKELVLWIMAKLEPGKDVIWINKEYYMKKMNITSRTTLHTAITELLKQNLIARTEEEKDTYWINPRFFYNGNRLEKYKDNVKSNELDTTDSEFY